AMFNEPDEITITQLDERTAAGDPDARGTIDFIDNLDRFAFFDDLERSLARAGLGPARMLVDRQRVKTILEFVLTPSGLDYASLPKGLVKFHRYSDGGRTAFEEQLVEAALHVRDGDDVARLHFTVSPEHYEDFQARLEFAQESYEERCEVQFEVELSIQESSTDTIAVDLDNRPFRGADGKLLFRPGG